MKRYLRTAKKSITVSDGENKFKLIKGKEYTTSPVGVGLDLPLDKGPKRGYVTVYSNYWVTLPVDLFEEITG